MSDFTHDFDTEDDTPPTRPGQLSSNGQWIFGSIFATLILIGFGFGVWAGASRSKPIEVAVKKDDDKQKPPPAVTPPGPQPSPNPTPPNPPAGGNPTPMGNNPMPNPEPKGMNPEPKGMNPEPKGMNPEPKNTTPDPKPKDTEPSTPSIKAVSFKEIQPILRNYCGNCHGLAGKPKAGIDLRTLDAIKKGGDDGDIITMGNPKKSPLYDSIKDGRMPPDGKPGPSEKELQLIHDWILTGAKE